MLHAWITPTNNAGCCFRGENSLKPQVRRLISPHFYEKNKSFAKNKTIGTVREDLTQNTCQIPVWLNLLPSFNLFKSKGLFVFLDCPEAPSLAVDLAPPPTSWKAEIAWVFCAHIFCSVGSAKTWKDASETWEGSSTLKGMCVTFILYKVKHLPIYSLWHDYLSGTVLQQ